MGCCLLVLCLALQLGIQVEVLAVDREPCWMLGSLELCQCLLHCALCWETELQRFDMGCWCGTAVSDQTPSNPGAG